jgi:hypothetical protein
MLSEANVSIREASALAEEERQRRMEARFALSRAEELSAELEEVLLEGLPAVPPPLAREIRRFVAEHERAMVHRLGDPVATLDTLFDLQERLQARRNASEEIELIGRRVA